MSGHSHWAGIKRKKAVQDAKRARIFTKLGRAITIAARLGGKNPNFNTSLRLAIEKAKEFNMPKDKIENSVQKGSGEGADIRLEEIQYEALGPFGIMLIILVITDNRNRAVSDLRRILEKHGGKMADGGVSWNFKRAGSITISPDHKSKEEAMNLAIENGADDIIEIKNGAMTVYSAPENYNHLKEKLLSFNILESSTGYFPQNPISVEPANREKYERLIEDLTDHPDVQEVFDNVQDM